MQATAAPSGTTHLARANNAINKARAGAAVPIVKRQDDDDGSYDDNSGSGRLLLGK